MSEENKLRTGTTTVALMCKDGAVLAADRRATAGNLIVDKRAQKIHPIADDMAITIAGTVSDAQLLIKLMKAEIKLKEIRVDRKLSVKEVGNLISGLVYENIRKLSLIPGISHFLLGGKDESGVYIYDIFPDGSLSPIEDFVASGSGSELVYGLLEAQYDKEMNIEQGVDLAIRAINSSLQRDTASGNGLDVITITKAGVKKAFEKTLITRVTR